MAHCGYPGSQRTEAELPRLSIVIPTLGQENLLDACLGSIGQAAGPPREIIVIDDYSPGSAVRNLCARHDHVRYLRTDRRLGFSRALNMGIRAACGEIVFLLNDDTEIDGDCLSEACRAFDDDAQVTAVAPVTLVHAHPETVESAGQAYAFIGRAERVGYGSKIDDQAADRAPIFGPTGAAAFYRRGALLETGLFDEDFGAYYEDVDLNFRLQLRGGKAVVVPGSRLRHHISASYGKNSSLKTFFSSRNMEYVFFQNMPARLLLRFLPEHLLLNALLAGHKALHGQVGPFLRGKASFLLSLPSVLRKRRQRQAMRTVSLRPSRDDDRIWLAHAAWRLWWQQLRIIGLFPKRRPRPVASVGLRPGPVATSELRPRDVPSAAPTWPRRMLLAAARWLDRSSLFGSRLRRTLYLVVFFFSRLRMLWLDRHSFGASVRDIAQRTGFYRAFAERSVWIHGEGLGEFNAADALIESLKRQFPDHRLALTSGRAATIQWLAARRPGEIVLPVPWDVAPIVGRFLSRLNPRLLILLEFHDGFCPGALQRLCRVGVPVMVANGRLLNGPKSFRFELAEALSLVRHTSRFIDRFCLQSQRDVPGLMEWGVEPSRMTVTGNMKFDASAPVEDQAERPLMRSLLRIATDVPVLVAGCVHPEEEDLFLNVFERLKQAWADLVLVLAPQNPGQADAIAASLTRRKLGFSRRSRSQEWGGASVVLLDTQGELRATYAIATVAIIGGSFYEGGPGHSLVEPAAWGIAIAFGPSMESQRDMAETFLANAAAVQTTDSTLADTVAQLLRDPSWRASLGKRARQTVFENAGATDRAWKVVEGLLTEPRRTSLQPLRSTPFVKELAKELVRTAAGQRLLALRASRMDSFESLRERLGRPDTILCLGNGPSSEDLSLEKIGWDCLFRVNWQWRLRSRFTRPAVVFTGDPRTLDVCKHSIYGFQTIAVESAIVPRKIFSRLSRLEYFTMERLPSALGAERWSARPTNGAAMIAAAVALRPQRLIIAGIDLYEHPAGKYPGDPISANEYAAAHHRDVELAIIDLALDGFDGDIVIVGDILKSRLAAMRGRPRVVRSRRERLTTSQAQIEYERTI